MELQSDIYQQAYLDHVLTPKSLTRLIANSGSGKSTTIASKVALLLNDGQDPKSIIAITFTNKSAWDLRSKIKHASNQIIPYCSTFHGLSIMLLKENNVKPVIMNEWQAILLIRKIMELNNLSTGNKRQDTTLARDFMNKFNYMRTITYYFDIMAFPFLDHFTDLTINTNQFINIYMEYDLHKKSKNLWDFQDLISPRAEKLIVIKPDARLIWIDESQDSDFSQYVWLTNLYPEAGYTLVGDTKQCLDYHTMVHVRNEFEEKFTEIGNIQRMLFDYKKVEVMSRHGWATVTEFIPRGVKRTIEVNFKNGSRLVCTPDHLIETTLDGWVKAIDLMVGNYTALYEVDNMPYHVSSKIYCQLPVCDINILEDHHSFLANGVSVHNCLYTFRQAYPEPMEKDDFFLERGFGKFDNFPLVNNYRSTANIVRLFNMTAKKYDHLPSIPHHPESAGSVKIIKFEENTQEGHYIAKRIKELIAEGEKPSNITVLSRRSSYLKQIVEPCLVSQGIPYILSTPIYKIKFFEVPLNALYFALLSYVVSDDLNKLAEASLHLRGIGKTNNERITDEVFNNGISTNQIFLSHLRVIDDQKEHFIGLVESSQLALRIIPLIAKEDIWTEIKLQSIHKIFVSFIKHMEYEGVNFSDAETAIQTVLDTIYEYHADTSDAVTLTTIHSYKGLENNVIFLGDLTYIGSMDIDASTYPTVYVALSRAKKHLTVCYSEKVIDRKLGKIKSKLHPAFNFTLNQIGK